MDEEDVFQEQDLSDASDEDIRRMVDDTPAPEQEPEAPPPPEQDLSQASDEDIRRMVEDQEMAEDVARREPVETTGEPRSVEPQPPPTDLSEASDEDIRRMVDEGAQPQQTKQPEGAPEAEGAVGSAARAAVHSVAPMTAAAAGAAAGAAIGSAIPGLGTLVGGIGGALIGGLGVGTAASMAQEWLLNKFGFGDEAQQAANQAAHPWATGVGTVAGALPTFGVGGGAALAARALSGVIGGGVDLAMTGDPQHAAAVGLASTALNKPTALGTAALGAGERLGAAITGGAGAKISSLLAEKVQETRSLDAEAPTTPEAQLAQQEGASEKSGPYPPGFPGEAPSPARDVHQNDVVTSGTDKPGPVSAPGTAEDSIKPLERGIVSEPQNQPTRDMGNKGVYAKDETQVQVGGQEPTQLGAISSDLRAALGHEQEAPAPAGGRAPEPPVQERAPVQQTAQEQPPPAWLKANQDEAIAKFKGTPVEKTIGDMARAGKTAAEIEAATGVDRATVRVLRDNMGIEPAGPQEGFLTQPGQNKPIVEEPTVAGRKLDEEFPKVPNAEAQARPLIESLKEAEAKRTATTENPPNAALDEATQRALAAGAKHEGLGKAAVQQLRQEEAARRSSRGGQPPREPPPGGTRPPNEPPEPGPKDARLNKPPLLSSAPEGGVFRRTGNLLRRVFAPEFMSPASEKAGEVLRKGMGQMQALNDKWTGRLQKYYPEIEKLDKFGKDALTDKLEGGTAERFKDWKVPEALKPLLKENEEHNADYKKVIERLAKDPEHAEAVRDWQEQHLTHIYKNPEAEYQGGGGGIRGSGGSLNERKYATYEQALQEAGHERAHENPLDAQAAYRADLGNFLALRQAAQEMREGGHLKYAMPEKNVGASGQGSSLKARIHKDWEPVPGLTTQGRMAYMPRDAANVFNNHLMPDFSPNKDLATVERIWREGGNRASQMALGIWNGFHSFVVSTESMFSQIARGAGEATTSLLKGDTAGAMRGLKDIGTAPAAPVKNYLVGRQGQAAITGNESRPASAMEKQGLLRPLSEDDHAIIKAAQDAGYMPLGRSHAPDVNMTGAKDYYESYMKGQFGRMMQESVQRMKDSPLKNVPKEVWDHMGRVLQTLSRPLFQHYIPALKFGALIENARAAVRQGGWDLKTPEGQQKLTAFLRKESNVIDNRMGEMNAKNVFMNKAISRAGYGSMLSFSWMLGSARAVGGGTMSGLKSAVKDISSLAKGKFEGSEFANKLDMTHKDYDPNVAYAITFPIGAALMGAAYTFMRTGEMPQDWRDLYFPRTGGKVPGLGGRGEVDERIMLPGYHKEFFGWTEKGLGEAYAKMNPAIQAGVEELQNRDWRNLPIVRPDATLAQSAADRAAHIGSKVGPLAVKTQMETPKQGTALSRGERMLGFRPTGMQHTDPTALKNYLDAKYKKDWQTKVRSEERAAAGGVNPPKEKKPRNSTLVRP